MPFPFYVPWSVKCSTNSHTHSLPCVYCVPTWRTDINWGIFIYLAVACNYGKFELVINQNSLPPSTLHRNSRVKSSRKTILITICIEESVLLFVWCLNCSHLITCSLNKAVIIKASKYLPGTFAAAHSWRHVSEIFALYNFIANSFPCSFGITQGNYCNFYVTHCLEFCSLSH
jgi:hypothetical protein